MNKKIKYFTIFLILLSFLLNIKTLHASFSSLAGQYGYTLTSDGLSELNDLGITEDEQFEYLIRHFMETEEAEIDDDAVSGAFDRAVEYVQDLADDTFDGDDIGSFKAADEPVAVIGTELVNAFGDKVAELRIVSRDGDDLTYGVYLNDSYTGETYRPGAWDRFWNDGGVFDIEEKIRNKIDVNSCWECKMIDYSFDAISILGNMIYGTLQNHIFALAGLLTGLWLAFYLFFSLSKGDPRQFISQFASKIFAMLVAVLLIANIDGTIFYYVLKPVIWFSLDLSNTVLEADDVECNYNKNETDDDSWLPSTARVSTEEEAMTEMNMKEDVICNIHKNKRINGYQQILAWILIRYGDSFLSLKDAFVGGIMWIIFFIINILIALRYLEAIFHMGIAALLIPFAIIAWALPVPMAKELPKRVFSFFLHASFLFLFIGIFTIISVNILNTAFFGMGVNLQGVENGDYTLTMLLNLLAYQSYTLLDVLISSVIALFMLSQVSNWANKFEKVLAQSDIRKTLIQGGKNFIGKAKSAGRKAIKKIF